MKSAAASEDTEGEVLAPRDAFRVALPNFEGPLDLLLHLIREHKLDVLDIPLALITEKYIEHLGRMRQIDLDVAGEFLVMASTLLHLKSRLLLPRDEVAAQGPEAVAAEASDPRAELVRRLLEYQKYKDAAQTLAQQDILDRNVFTRRVSPGVVPLDPDESGLREISVFKLIEALDRVLKNLEPRFQHEVVRDRLSLSDAIHRIADQLREGGRVGFFALFAGSKSRAQIIIVFLAILEMAKLKLIRVFQENDGEDILLEPKGDAGKALAQTSAEEIDRDFT